MSEKKIMKLNSLLAEYNIKEEAVKNLSISFYLFQLNKEEIQKLNKELEILRLKIKAQQFKVTVAILSHLRFN